MATLDETIADEKAKAADVRAIGRERAKAFMAELAPYEGRKHRNGGRLHFETADVSEPYRWTEIQIYTVHKDRFLWWAWTTRKHIGYVHCSTTSWLTIFREPEDWSHSLVVRGDHDAITRRQIALWIMRAVKPTARREGD